MQKKDEWIDWDNNTAYFDSDEFKALLEYAKNYESFCDNGTGDTETRWQLGDVMLYTRPVTDIYIYLWLKEIMENDLVAIGYPSADGQAVNKLCAYGEYGINVNSECKEGAWEFIEFLVLNQNKPKTYKNAIPTLKSAMDNILNSSLEEEHMVNEYKLQATEQDIDNFKEMIAEMSCRDSGRGAIYRIMDEELNACFSGERCK